MIQDDCQKRIGSANDLLDHIIDNHQMGGTDNNLLSIPVENPLVVEKFCQVHLYPYIDPDNKCYYECKVNQLKHLLESCHQDISNIDQITANLDPTETVLIDMPSTDQAIKLNESETRLLEANAKVLTAGNKTNKLSNTKRHSWYNSEKHDQDSVDISSESEPAV